MLSEVIKIKGLKKLFLSVASVAVCLGLIIFSEKAKQGVMTSMTLCKDVLIPSMFPFLILSNFVANSQVSQVIGKAMKPICNHVFHISELAGSAILLGLTCGYPMGAVITDRLMENGEIDKETGKRMLRFCYSSGLPFAVTAVGTVLLGSTKLGVIIWASNTIGAVIIGIFDGVGYRKTVQPHRAEWLFQPASSSLVKSVKSSVNAMVNVCAYVILFGCLSGVIESLGSVKAYALSLLEITNGAKNSIGILPVPLIAFYTGIGGVCIHLQLQEVCNEAGMSFFEFFKYRIIQGILSGFICWVFMKIFPTTIDVFSNISSVQREFFSVSAVATVIMIIMCIILLVDIENKKKTC